MTKDDRYHRNGRAIDPSERVGYWRDFRRGLIIVDEEACCSGFADGWRDLENQRTYVRNHAAGLNLCCAVANLRSREFCRVEVEQ